MATTRVEPAVCFGSSQRSWVTELINFVTDHGGIRVVGTALTQDDAIDMQFDVLVIDDVSSVLTPRLVDRLHATERVVIGVFDAERAELARERLLAMGVDGVVASDATAAEIVRSVADGVRQSSIDTEFDALIDDFDADRTTPAPTDVPAPPPPFGRPLDAGRVLVVLGSDGATEAAVALAHAMVQRDVSCVLVDLDTVEPSIAQRLAMPLTPNIFTATEHLRLRTKLDDGFRRHPEGFAVIAGIPNPREWENISEIEASDLVGELASGFGSVIVSASRHLEDLSSFGGSAGRFDIGRRLVGEADDIIVVGSASPLGNTRLIAMISDVRQLSAARIHVFINKAPGDNFIQGEIREEIERSAALESVVFLPSDSRVTKASWQGDLVRKGAYARKVTSAADIFGARTKQRRSVRRSSEAVPEPTADDATSAVGDLL